MRIVHVAFGLDVGGLEKLLLEFAAHADPERMRLLFVSLGCNGAVGEELRRMGWPVVCLYRQDGFQPVIVAQLARIFRGARADVVHTHDARALIYGGPAARLAHVRKVVHTQHGQGLGMSRRQVWLMKMAAMATSKFVCVSRDAARIASDNFGVPPHKLCTIYNGIDIERYMADESTGCGPDSEGPIVAVARLSPEKGIGTLLDAVAMARESAPDIRLEIAGDGPCLHALQEQCDDLGLSDCTDFLGHVDDVPSLLHRARLFVLPSESEGIALTLLEAMAAGVAVIATRVGGSPEVVVDDHTGVLVPPRDAPTMADAISRLWMDFEERERLAAAGRWRVRELFDVERMVQDYSDIYCDKTPRTLRDDPTSEGAAAHVAS
jgi:glycosyltransferase involved in cell wall biosynthesis